MHSSISSSSDTNTSKPSGGIFPIPIQSHPPSLYQPSPILSSSEHSSSHSLEPSRTHLELSLAGIKSLYPTLIGHIQAYRQYRDRLMSRKTRLTRHLQHGKEEAILLRNLHAEILDLHIEEIHHSLLRTHSESIVQHPSTSIGLSLKSLRLDLPNPQSIERLKQQVSMNVHSMIWSKALQFYSLGKELSQKIATLKFYRKMIGRRVEKYGRGLGR